MFAIDLRIEVEGTASPQAATTPPHPLPRATRGNEPGQTAPVLAQRCTQRWFRQAAIVAARHRPRRTCNLGASWLLVDSFRCRQPCELTEGAVQHPPCEREPAGARVVVSGGKMGGKDKGQGLSSELGA